MFRAYYLLTKPGIIYGNILTTIAGFLLASRWHINFWLFAATVLGTSLVIASACVFNNYIDRKIDRKMARTKKRALVQGHIKGRYALALASILGIIGFIILIRYVNILTVGVGFVGFVDYVVLYGLSKRHSVFGTIVGSVSGATPIVAGYVAVTSRLDLGALLLFLILAFWQMPHFYAIAMYRHDDYKAAGLPVWPVRRGMASTKRQIFLFTLAFVVASLLLSFYGYAGYTYALIVGILGLSWLWRATQGFNAQDDRLWGRGMFLSSLIVIMGLSAMLSVGSLLP